MQNLPLFVELNSKSSSLVIDCRNKAPAIIYWGKRLSEHTSLKMLTLLATRQEAKCSPVVEAPISLSPLYGEGFTGAVGIEVSNDDIAWSLGTKLVSVVNDIEDFKHSVTLTSIDKHRQIRIIHRLCLYHHSNVFTATSEIENVHTQSLTVHHCATPTLPLPDDIDQVMSFEGRWANEFQQQSMDLFLGSFVRENRKGKTSHDTFPAMVLHNKYTHEQAGNCYGVHLGHSGNHKMRVELLADGRRYIQLAELLLPNEIVLATGQSYQSPTLFAAYSDQGFSGLSHCFHQFVREEILSAQVQNTPRPIHYNTWEGLYFSHDINTLKQLANKVADLGVERFVLDDGWFKGRRGDNAGLGDWFVDKSIYPQGLTPIIDHVKALGMSFGLWFEPEMVNPNSDLYRKHPDWILATTGNEQLTFRNQYVLDLTRAEVREYLFNVINNILTQYPDIAYIKWDMNRDINHAGNYQGQPAIHHQTQAVYQLITRIKQQHPTLEIESCSSGGGRADYGILSHTDRIWTSDSNDALDRLAIQRGFSFFFPSEIMGAHIGPRQCHITGRVVDISMRAAVAFFGHLGLEMDPRELTEQESATIKTIIALHKQHRQLIHHGQLHRINNDGNSINFVMVNAEQTQAILAYNSITETARTTPVRLKLIGLAPEKNYQLTLIWPTALKEYSPSILSQVNGEVFSGEALMTFGMQLPIVNPQTSLIFELYCCSSKIQKNLTG